MRRRARVTSKILWIALLASLAACAGPARPTAAPSPTDAVETALPTEVRSVHAPTLTATAAGPSATLTPLVPTFTPRPNKYDAIDARTVLSTLFPELKLTPVSGGLRVNGDRNWTMWVNSRAEGQFTQNKTTELAVIVANEAPHLSPQAQQTTPHGSFLAIFQVSNGMLRAVQRSFLFPVGMSPLTFDVSIQRVVDYDHDGLNEILIVTNTTRLGMASSAAFLYQWNEHSFVELWSAPVGEDNTGALNQSAYYATTSDIQVKDLDGDGFDEIVLESTRVEYGRTDQGLPNLDRETSRRVERRVFRWDGTSFVSDPARATPFVFSTNDTPSP